MAQNRMSRRTFAASSLACVSLGAMSAGTAAASDSFGGFKVGAQSYTWRKFSLEQTLAQMKDIGLGYIEFATGHISPDATMAQVNSVARLCKSYDVTPAAAGVYPFTKDIDQNRRVFDFAKMLGIDVLSADPTPDSFDVLDKLCEEYKVAVAIHPHGPSGSRLHRWYSAQVILDAVKDHHPLIGSCLDTGHLIRCAQSPFLQKLDPAEQIRVMGKRNFGIHLKDHDNQTREDVVFGKGVLDVPAVLQALRDVEFSHSISIEHEANADNPTADVRDCVEVVRRSTASLE